jgi:2-hydroxychromene-2-carboxylate isomerase
MASAGDTSMAIGSPAPATMDPKMITVYANSINPISYSGEADGVAAFDIVFSVGVNCGDSSKTYQVVKRIGIDKARIAAEVENAQPMSIVEAQPAPVVEEKKQVITEVQRMRRLAGL